MYGREQVRGSQTRLERGEPCLSTALPTTIWAVLTRIPRMPQHINMIYVVEEALITQI